MAPRDRLHHNPVPIRGLNRDLLARAQEAHPGRSQGSLLNEALQCLLDRDHDHQGSTVTIGGLVVHRGDDPHLDLRALETIDRPGVSLSELVMANR